MVDPPKKNPVPRLLRTAQDGFGRGLVTAGGRTDVPRDGLWVAENAVITHGGSVESRRPFVRSRVPDLPPGGFAGPVFSYWDQGTEAFDLLAIVGGTLWSHSDGSGSWDEVLQPDGAVTFSTSRMASFARYGDLVAIADGESPLAYFRVPQQGAPASVTRPGDEVSQNPQMSLSGAAAEGDYRAYYLVSYVNDFGETPASGGGPFDTGPAWATVALDDPMAPLGKWANEVVIDVSGVDTSLSHNARVRVYRVLTPDFLSPSVTAFQLVKEYPVSDGDQSFADDGTVAGRVIAPQLENSTGGLVGRYVTEIDGRLWVLGAGAERQKVYYTGAAPTDSAYPQFFTGDGGYFYVAYGTSFEPVVIRRGRADDGQICNFVLCAGPDGQGRRFNVLSLEASYGSQTVHQFYPSEQRGDEGAYSTFGVLDYMNSILYPSSGGFKSSGVRAAYTGDNVTAAIDSAVADTVLAIPFSTFRTMYGTVHDGKAIWHTGPASMLVFDARRNGAWTTWTGPHSWFGSLSFGRDKAALYLVNGRRVLRYSDSPERPERDLLGPAHPVRLASGVLTVRPDDGREWVRLLNVLFVFSALVGPVTLTVGANSRRRLERYTGTVTVGRGVFGADGYRGAEPVGFSGMKAQGPDAPRGAFSTPSSWSDGPFIVRYDATSGTAEVRVRVNKDVNSLFWEVRSEDGFVRMRLDGFVYEYVDIGVGLDFSSRYNEVRLTTVRG